MHSLIRATQSRHNATAVVGQLARQPSLKECVRDAGPFTSLLTTNAGVLF